MRQWLRSHLTYANVMVTILAFIVLGGMSYAATGGNFILGQSNSASSTTSLTRTGANAGKGLQVTNTSTGAGATALGLSVASGHPPFTVNSGTKVTNLNADKLDGKDSTGFIGGSGRIVPIDVVNPTPGSSATLFDLPGLVKVYGNCGGTSFNGTTLVQSYDLPVDVLSDNGGGNPVHERIDANNLESNPAWDTAPGGELLMFSFEASGKVATAFVFSYAFHNPVLNEDRCHYQGHVIAKGA
jgi:hypothetical protein